MKWFKIFLVLGVVSVIGLTLGCNSADKSAEQPQQAAVVPTGKVMQLDVEGMTCNGCETTIKMTLKKLDGVQKVDADYKAGAARVVYDPEKVSQEGVIQALEKVGYKAKPRPSS